MKLDSVDDFIEPSLAQVAIVPRASPSSPYSQDLSIPPTFTVCLYEGEFGMKE